MLTFYEKARAAEQVARACRVLGKLDATVGTSGHVSYRTGDHQLLIKGKGVEETGLRFTKPRDIIEIDFDGDPIDAPDGLRSPSECFIHIQLMKAHSEIQSVVHCHPEKAVILTILDRKILPFSNNAGQRDLIPADGLPTYPHSHQIETPELGNALALSMGSCKAALMRGHGLTAYDTSIENAVVRVLRVDYLVNMTYKALLIGTPTPLTADELADKQSVKAPKTRGGLGGDAGAPAKWRYYCDLTDEDYS